MDYISGIEAAFRKYIGENSIDGLRSAITKKPMILIAGDQLTGNLHRLRVWQSILVELSALWECFSGKLQQTEV